MKRDRPGFWDPRRRRIRCKGRVLGTGPALENHDEEGTHLAVIQVLPRRLIPGA